MAITRVGVDASAVSIATPLALTYPTGIGNNDLITLVVAVNASGTVTTPAGYTLLDTLTNGTSVIRLYGKISASESGALNVAFATATRVVGVIAVRRAGTNFNTTVLANNYSTFQHDSSAVGGTAITSTALTGVPATPAAWSMAFGGGIGTQASGATCTVSGSGWTKQTDNDQGGSSIHTMLVNADDPSDTGTLAGATFTWTQTLDARSVISFFIREAQYLIVGAGGTWSWTGGAATLLFNHLLIGVGAAWSWTGGAASMLWNHLLVGTGAAWSWTGGAAILTYNRILSAAGAVWSWTGGSAFFYKYRVVEALRSAGNTVAEAARAVTGVIKEALRSPQNSDKEDLR